MKRIRYWESFFVMIVIFLAIFAWSASDVSALPEYSAQTGEPCATCHISPSGGGPRSPRGQAWIADEKPGTVPDLLSSLELLGVSLDINPSDFNDVPDEIPPAQPLPYQQKQVEMLYQHLSAYSGN